MRAATEAAWSTGDPAQALANAVPYMQAFGHMVLAWIWLDVALALPEAPQRPAAGPAAATRYFYRYELPKIGAWLAWPRAATRPAPTCRRRPSDGLGHGMLAWIDRLIWI